MSDLFEEPDNATTLTPEERDALIPAHITYRRELNEARLELHPEAQAELRSAALWYDERRPGLGDKFISEISASLDRVRDAPESYRAWPRTRAAGPLIRKATIQRFPYAFAKRHLR